jgi:DNA-binding MarR family transcriptional regulator
VSRFNRGWVKLHREVVEEDIGRNGIYLAVWVTLLSWATRFETSIPRNEERVTLSPGSVVTSIRELADHLGFSRSSIARALKYLEKRDSIRVASGTVGSVVTVCNWDKYQSAEDEAETRPGHEPDTAGTPVGRQSALNGEVRKKNTISAVVENSTPTRVEACGAIPELSGQEVVEQALSQVKQSTQRLWVKSYGDTAWLAAEIIKAANWLEVNPKRKPRSFAKFMGGWFARNWDKHRKSIPTTKINIKPIELESA